MRLTHGTLCCPDRLRHDLDLVIEGGRIRLLPADPHADDAIDLGGSYVLPGFIELHTHGAGLFEFTMGRYDPRTGSFDGSEEAYARELPAYAKRRASTGVTAGYLGTWASPVEKQRFCFRQLKKYIDSPNNGRDGMRILGGLLEGTFINPEMAGAQNPDFVFEPDISLFDRLNQTGVIRLVNVVPDWGEPACRLIRRLAGEGISAGAGHSAATYEQFARAIESGLKYCIHFLNGPIGHSYKSFDGGGAVEAVLCEDIYAEIIADGVHVAPRYVRDVIARKGVDRILAVSDAMFSSQARGVNEFIISGVKGKVHESGKFVYVVGTKPTTLFSSIVTMDVAFSNLLSWLTTAMDGVWRRHDAMNFEEAILAASRCCSTNIVEMLKRNGGDDLETGALADGRWADLVVGEIEGQPGNYKFNVKNVYVQGRKVWVGSPSQETSTEGG